MANTKSGQHSVSDSAYTEISAEGVLDNTLILYSDSALLLSVGHDVPSDSTSFIMPANSSLDLRPTPIGLVSVKAVSGSATVYKLVS
jgi:hypothetical protein